mmetsp:Transcript_6893/g.20295  ORF Transcript_6893/g.20295 Transcript_6893/m.20295 type:complete len:207 (-) Transcript_6893:22-642(-)
MAVVVGKTQAVTFLRHGQSQGNVAKSLGMDRKRDERLVDCGLTKLGAQQAAHVADNMAEAPELIVASPLARALATALLLKTGAPMVVHPGVREIGSRIPENRTRPVAALKRDGALAALPGFDDVDFALVEDLRDGDGPQNPLAAALTLQAFSDWLRQRPERRIWVVAHHNTIGWLLRDTAIRGGSIPNCVPIATELSEAGFALVGT